jgi:hypothetical protein
MLCWKIWNQAKGLGCRPSQLYDIEWPLTRFYFDRAIYWWGTHVEGKISEAEANMRQRMKKSRGNVDAFVTSARISTFNKLMGLSTAAAYASPVSTAGLTKKSEKSKTPTKFGKERMFAG